MKCGLNNCEGLVKPDIVFFGEALPLTFSQNAHKIEEADLVFVMGTSLKVIIDFSNLCVYNYIKVFPFAALI